ncbi:hypothetical protein LWI28_012249 [Acer negundo]|uniref:Uncharacterized protein n=1 Tax=Acer negundo TaxID=4023 RepID=A0AAD5JDQ5_ACENE|nr:hypothetical protein LWI28_012249 [Acer negundo]
MKSLRESLVAAGQPLSKGELISQILGGIGFEYDVVVVNITARQGQISFEEVQLLLMSYESRLAQHNDVMSLDMTQAQAHYSNFRGNNMRGRSRGRGRGRNRGGSRFVCQLCGKTSHVVYSCYKRFDQAFQGLSLQNMQSQSQQGTYNNNSRFNGGLGNYQAHMSQCYPNFSNFSDQMQGYSGSSVNPSAFVASPIASPSTVMDPTCLHQLQHLVYLAYSLQLLPPKLLILHMFSPLIPW